MNIVAHNLLAMNANRQLQVTGKKKGNDIEKLSSGYRINKAADDAAGLQISEKMRKQIGGLTQGVQNTQEGISLCQVADGALAEVQEMLLRLTELSVHAANGTLSSSDRMAIQREVNRIMEEINRIGDTTKFNDTYLFRGGDAVKGVEYSSPSILGSVPFEDFSLSDVDLGYHPFSAGSGANQMNLEAIVSNPDSPAYGSEFGLIFGGGSTSNSSIRLTYTGDDGNPVIDEVPFDSLIPGNYAEGHTPEGNSFWTRDLVYQNADGAAVKITQRIEADSRGDTEKKYKISYAFENTGTRDVNMDFMFHADTAYNNNDNCEGYFVDGQRIERSCIYSEPGSPFTAGETNPEIHNGVPDSLSIIDTEQALAFSEKIAFTGEKPDSFSIGYYFSIDDWNYYDNLDWNLGQDMMRQDLGFGLMWNRSLAANSSWSVSFDYGICKTDSDANLQNVQLTNDGRQTVVYGHSRQTLWIQSGADTGDGLQIDLAEMNAQKLGIADLNLTTIAGADRAMGCVEGAIRYISNFRSRIGAQQNRLEHTVANEDNIIENTTRAESAIRDADMAAEMVNYSKHSILEQAGQAMLAQTNQMGQGVLELLQ